MRTSRLPFALLAALPIFAACGGSTASTDPPGGPAPVASATTKKPPGTPPPDDTGTTPVDTSWCGAASGGPHALCADFDQGVRPYGWDFFDGDDMNNRDPYDFTTPGTHGTAFHVSGPALKGPGDPSGMGPFSGSVVDAKAQPTTGSKGRVGFDIKVDENDDELQPVQLEARTADKKNIVYDVWFVTSSTSTQILATFDGSDAPVAQFPPVPQGRWVHVDLYLDDVKGTVSLSFDGAPIGSVPLAGKLAAGVETTLYVGVTRTAPSGAYDMSFDDVTLDWQ
jgi:hypothetical protein